MARPDPFEDLIQAHVRGDDPYRLLQQLLTETEPARGPSRLQPVGIQDLIVMRSRHLGYRLAELSHIENIAPGELREREHRTETEYETLFVEELERETETREDLASTTKDELRNEIQRQTREQVDLSGKVRTTYRGPVEVEATVSADYSRETTRSTNTVRNHAIEVTEEASSRVRERALRRTERRLRRLITETNQHRFENPSDEGRSVQYVWLQKMDRVSLYSYGKRCLYEIVVPEPAAHLRSLTAKAPPRQLPFKPPPTDLFQSLMDGEADVLELWQNGEIVKHFNLSDLTPPPAEEWVQTVIQNDQSKEEGATNFLSAKDQLDVPEGREASHLHVSVQTHEEGGPHIPALSLALNDFELWVNLDTLDRKSSETTPNRVRPGTWTYTHGSSAEQTGSFDDQPFPGVLSFDIPLGTPWPAGTHEVAVLADDFTSLSVTASLKTGLSEEGHHAWRRALLAAVVEDYWRQYENYLSMALAGEPTVGPGLLEDLSDAQAAELREIERDEIKRAVISVMRGTDIPGPDPMSDDDRPAVSEWYRSNPLYRSEILFLEQAFEWQHMNFVLYGYHWADQADWSLQIFGMHGGDRGFREFLKAGAARVQLPVRPGFEGFVEDYMLDGVVWSGGDRPPIGSPGYVDFITERAEAMGAPGDEEPVAEMSADGSSKWPIYWDVTNPTDLVMLKTWDTPDEAPLDRWVPPAPDDLIVGSDERCPDPLQNWSFESGPVPDAPHL